MIIRSTTDNEDIISDWNAITCQYVKTAQADLTVKDTQNCSKVTHKYSSCPRFCLTTIELWNHLIPSRTQKWNEASPMVVWGFPCESRSSSGFYLKTQLNSWVFFVSDSNGMQSCLLCKVFANRLLRGMLVIWQQRIQPTLLWQGKWLNATFR